MKKILIYISVFLMLLTPITLLAEEEIVFNNENPESEIVEDEILEESNPAPDLNPEEDLIQNEDNDNSEEIFENINEDENDDTDDSPEFIHASVDCENSVFYIDGNSFRMDILLDEFIEYYSDYPFSYYGDLDIAGFLAYDNKIIMFEDSIISTTDTGDIISNVSYCNSNSYDPNAPVEYSEHDIGSYFNLIKLYIESLANMEGFHNITWIILISGIAYYFGSAFKSGRF